MGRRIKRTRPLYRRRRSKVKTIIGTIVFVLLAATLVVVGYSVGDTIVDYFKNKPDIQNSSWSPESTDSQSQNSGSTSSDDSSSEPSEVPIKSQYAYVYQLPENAVLSLDTLNSELDKAVSAKAEGVIVTLKNDLNGILYKSEKYNAPEERALTLEQIVSAIKAKNLTPQARIGTLKDHISMGNIPALNYIFKDDVYTWLDNAPEAGGKPWINPFNNESVEFISNLAQEISIAGFEEVYCKDLIFPNFMDYDYTVLANIGDSSKRVLALQTVANYVYEKVGERTYIEVSASQFMNDGAFYLGNAEVISANASSLKAKVSLKVESSLLGQKVLRKNDTEITMPSSYIELVKSIANELVKVVPVENAQLVLEKSALSDTEIETLKTELANLKLVNLVFV